MKISIENLVKILVERENKGMRFVGVKSHRKIELLKKNRITKQSTDEALGFTSVVKHSSYNPMLGASYRNKLAKEQSVKPSEVEIGERKDGAERIENSSVLVGKDGKHRLELSPHKANPSVYMVAGQAYSKDDLVDYLPASELRKEAPKVFSIRLANIDSISIDGENYEPIA